jgi:hypothetical protein
MRIISIVVFLLFLSGCAGTIPVNYQPQNFIRCTGAVGIGEFEYQPYKVGTVGKPNQIQNTALGSIYIGSNVNDLVQRATALELEKTGVMINDQCTTYLEGNVLEFKAGDLGYSVQWYYSIKYKLKNIASGETYLDKVYTPGMRKTGKFGSPSDLAPVINEMILDGYTLFISDPEAKKILGKGDIKADLP